MGSSQSLSQSELYALFSEVDVNNSDSLDLSEVSRLCQLIWTKEGMSSTLPAQVAQTVFDLLDLDGDGVITRQEFELLVEEVYTDRKNLVPGKQSSWLGFLGVPDPLDSSDPPSLVPDLQEELPSPEPERLDTKKKKTRKKLDDLSDHDSDVSSVKSQASSVSMPEEVRENPEIPAEPEGGGGWFSGISSYFQDQKISDSPAKALVDKVKEDKAVEQETGPFWRNLLGDRKKEEIPVPAGPVAVAVVPLRQFLMTQPQMTATERALKYATRPVRPWPVDIAPLWQPPVQKW